MDAAVPHYRQIADTLRANIASGLYVAGERLPTAQALEDRFGVSNITIRKALDLLAREGRVIGRRGVGTIVAPEPAADRVPIRITGDFREWLNSAGAKRFPVEQRVLDIETARAPARVCTLLGLEAGAAAWRMRRLRYRDGQAISYHVNYGAPDRFGWITEKTFAGGRGFVETISAHDGISLKRMAQRVEAVTADLELANLLATGFGQALFFVENVYRDADDAVLAVTHLYLRADCYTYEVEIDLGGSMLRDPASA